MDWLMNLPITLLRLPVGLIMMPINPVRIFPSPEGRQLQHLLIETQVCEFPWEREVPIYLF